MATGKALKGRIKSAQNIRKITRTMELVATSKLKRAQDRVIGARPYAEALAQSSRISTARSWRSVFRCCGSRRLPQRAGRPARRSSW